MNNIPNNQVKFSHQPENEINTPAVYRIPVEIWDKILFGNLNPGKDLHSLYNASFIWGRILEETKLEWMFVQVLPIIVEQLSRKDVLNCRQVCKRRRFGVDNFLENNVAQRPSRDNNISRNNENLQNWFADEKLEYNLGSLVKQKTLLDQAVEHPRNPLVGRSVSIQYPQPLQLPNDQRRYSNQIGVQVLGTFGCHIHFLRILFFQNPPQNLLIYFVQLFELADLSNLKKLEINYWYTETDQDEYVVEEQLQQYINSLTENQRSRFPKRLETLIITGIYGFCALKLHEIFVSLFSNSLTSFTKWNTKPFVFPANILFTNLTHLTMCVGSVKTLQSLLSLNSSIQRLSLHFTINKPHSIELLMQVISSFSGTLKVLELQLPQTDPSCVKNMIPFLTPGNLKLPHISNLTFSNYLPPSFNFIFGFKSLQYLNFNLNPRYIKKHQLQWVNVIYPEKLDIGSVLLKVSSKSETSKQTILYSSNVWKTFRRLKVLKFNGLKSGKKLELRRDIYEILN